MKPYEKRIEEMRKETDLWILQSIQDSEKAKAYNAAIDDILPIIAEEIAKEREQAYGEGYKQGKFDAQMDASNSLADNTKEVCPTP